MIDIDGESHGKAGIAEATPATTDERMSGESAHSPQLAALEHPRVSPPQVSDCPSKSPKYILEVFSDQKKVRIQHRGRHLNKVFGWNDADAFLEFVRSQAPKEIDDTIPVGRTSSPSLHDIPGFGTITVPLKIALHRRIMMHSEPLRFTVSCVPNALRDLLPLQYVLKVYLRSLENGRRQLVGEIPGTFARQDESRLVPRVDRVEGGLYRVEVILHLRRTEEEPLQITGFCESERLMVL